MNARKNEPRDLLAAWLELSREVLAQIYPEATHATLVIDQGDRLPPTQIVVAASSHAAEATA